jgi:hypothetical protein
MHEIVCRSTEGLLRTGNLDSRCCRKARERAICDRRMRMFSQGPRESRSKARTGTGAHNHGAAGNQPCGQSSQMLALVLLKENKGKKTLSTKYCWRIGFPLFTFRRFGSSRYRRATLAIELGGRSIYLNGLFRYRCASLHRFFFAT